MKSRVRLVMKALAFCSALALQAQAQAQAPATPPSAAASAPAAPKIGQLKSLGQDRYQVGRIVVDKRAGTLTVPGRVLVRDKPLEYVATSPGGRKAYESLLELDASGSEMNLACILAGLERDSDVPAWKPLSVAGRVGRRVSLTLTWADGTQRRRLSAAEALLGPDASAKPGAFEWAYTGSFTSMDGSQLAADVTGTLISFVKKDPTGIIEVVSDAELGPYGNIQGNPALPPEGSAIELVIQATPAPR
ncbi:MAG: YdjY domain-containing protein [Burkholderiaceae bacterium]|nr:YdjY domain-containing protein [Burkholderiaceae bacterium]